MRVCVCVFVFAKRFYVQTRYTQLPKLPRTLRHGVRVICRRDGSVFVCLRAAVPVKPLNANSPLKVAIIDPGMHSAGFECSDFISFAKGCEHSVLYTILCSVVMCWSVLVLMIAFGAYKSTWTTWNFGSTLRIGCMRKAFLVLVL